MLHYIVLCLSIVVGTVGTATDDYQNVVDSYWKWKTETFPQFASSAGVRAGDSRLDNTSFADYEEWKTSLEELHDALEAVDKSALNDADKVNYAVLNSSIAIMLEGASFSSYAVNPVDFLSGLSTNDLVYSLVAYTKELQTYNDLLSRMRAYPDRIDQELNLMRTAISSGKINNNRSMIGAVANMNTTIAKFDKAPDSVVYYDIFRNMSSTGFNDSVIEKLQTDALAAINVIISKMREMKDFVEAEYIPNTREGYGVGSLENGLEYYQACLSWHTTTSMTAQEVHDKGLSEVKRITENMNKVKDALGFNGTLAEFTANITADRKNYMNSSEALLQTYRQQVEDLKTKVAPFFHKENIPNVPLIVKGMPFKGAGGMYSTPKKPGDPGIFYAEVSEYETLVTFGMLALTLHEALPGHHFQLAGQINNPKLPIYRQYNGGNDFFQVPFANPSYTAYVEGWALYAEYLGEEMNAYPTQLDLFGRYSSEMFRACRLVVDTGLHALGWSRQRALDYMIANVVDSPEQLAREIDRYITWPGQACSYKIGELKIRELRTKAETQLGDKFNIKDFHGVVLDLGAVSLNILEQQVNEWIEKVKSSNVSNGSSNINQFTNGVVCVILLIITCYARIH